MCTNDYASLNLLYVKFYNQAERSYSLYSNQILNNYFFLFFFTYESINLGSEKYLKNKFN